MLLEGHAGSIGELISEADRLAKAFKPDYRDAEELWFRGQRHSSESLLPNLYIDANAKFHYSEQSLLGRFCSWATPLVDSRPHTDWEWYFLARHHGLPSRLLDWSESLLVALFFSMNAHIPVTRIELDECAENPPASPVYDDLSPAVWMLEAGSLNKFAIGEDIILEPGGPITALYLPELFEEQPDKNEHPLAILPVRANRRIVAQQGMFTIHGRGKIGLDELARTHADIKLARIQIDRSRCSHIAKELEIAGINSLGLFPDLDTLARRVCWLFQSAV